MMDYKRKPDRITKGVNKDIHTFISLQRNGNVDEEVVKSFGEEWEKFENFSNEDLQRTGKMYFDILTEKHLNETTYAMDVGCGTGRWTKIIADRVAFVEAVDPSSAIFVADRLLERNANVRLTQATTDILPFEDETFDFVMSIGVLHHIPDTEKAMRDCVKKVKKGGYFYVYLYYSLDNRGFFFKLFFFISDLIRKIVSRLPSALKKISCDILACTLYMPFVLTGRLFRVMGLKRLAKKLPLSIYQNQSFYIIRNDALDRFGTKLEQRFSRDQVHEMMRNAGLHDIIISPGMPYWHAIGAKV